MEGSSQGFIPSSGGVTSSMGGISRSAAMYRAFEDYDRQARQRKYLIAELEDTIENLEKELKLIIEKNKAKEAECDRLQIAAQAAESNYEKKVKEKALMESNFRALSKEMDEVAMEIAKKKGQLKDAKLYHQQKIDQIRQKHEEFMKEYMKYPKCAALIEINDKVAKLTEILREKNQQLERRKREQKEARKKYKEEWQGFQKKCVRLAEVHGELRKKLAARDALKAEYDAKFNSPAQKAADLRRVKMMTQESQPTPSSSSRPAVVPVKPVPSVQCGIDGGGYAYSRYRRSSTFQQLDNLLCQSNSIRGSLAERRTAFNVSSDAGKSTWKNYYSPIKTGSTLVSQIRSKIKGTVLPMPRSQEAKEGSSSTSGQVTSIAATNYTQTRNAMASEKTNPPPPGEVTITMGELPVYHRPIQENATVTTAHPEPYRQPAHPEPFRQPTHPETFRQPAPPPPKPNQQKVVATSERMEVNEVELMPQAAGQERKNAEVAKPRESVAVDYSNFMDTSESSQKSTHDGATQGTSSQKSDGDTSHFSFLPPSAKPSQEESGSIFGLNVSGGNFFQGFFASPPSTPSESNKSPDFPFTFL